MNFTKKTPFKQAFIAFLILLLNTTPLSLADTFNDVSSGDRHYLAISQLKERGIINGYEDGSFKSNEKINRAEALKMIIGASGNISQEELDTYTVEETPFVDIASDAWFAKYIAIAKEKGIINGYEDDTFRAGDNINLAEALKILMESNPSLQYPEIGELYADATSNDWFAKYFALAKERTLLDIPLSNEAFPGKELTRGYLAEIIYRMSLSFEGYEFGKATFYGAAVQGHGTASGETFYKENFTAAHRELPFGTIVEVTNLANGKSVQVKINDRGPYGAGREIDLSSSAFSNLASLGTGVINVQYKVIQTP